MESLEPKLFPDAQFLKNFIGGLMLDESIDLEKITSCLAEIGKETRSMLSEELLMRSDYWHAFAISSKNANSEKLPPEVENSVRDVLTNLITSKLLPLLRS